MNKILEKEFKQVNQTSSRKRWFLTIECGQCATVFEKIYRKPEYNEPCTTCKKRKTAYHNFIKKATEKHKDRFSYDAITERNYINLFTPVTIYCKKHKLEFQQKPKDHVSLANGKQCCPACISDFAKTKNKRSIESWKEELITKHPTVTMVSHGSSDNNREEFTAHCSAHNHSFTSRLSNIRKYEYLCPECRKDYQDLNFFGNRFKRTDVKGYLYFLYLPAIQMYKLGVTERKTNRRFSELQTPYEVQWIIEYPTLAEAYNTEHQLFLQYKSLRYTGAPLLNTGGYTELITQLIDTPNSGIHISNDMSKEH